jgi:hypothetical protein
MCLVSCCSCRCLRNACQQWQFYCITHDSHLCHALSSTEAVAIACRLLGVQQRQ